MIGKKIKGLIGSRLDGGIDIWSGYDELLNKNGITLHGHTSTVGDLALSSDQRYILSGGSKDKMLMQWRLDLCRE